METWITGIGIVSPYGVGREIFWNGVRNGIDALRPIQRFDPSPYRNTLGGEVPDFHAGGMERAAAFAVQAAREAAEDARLDASESSLGLILATNFGGTECAEAAFRARALQEPASPDLSAYLPTHTLAAVREALSLAGPEAALSLSCASGAAALATALEWIRAGRAALALAGGFDELAESTVAGLSALRAISKDTIRPFDKNRSGTIFSEGAGVFVVESAEHARARGARPYCRLAGRGVNNDAFHMTAPEKTGRGIAAVMRMAMDDAAVEPQSIAHLNCHGTGTRYNDQIETLAIKEVFGAHAGRLVLTANKSLFGHAMGAAGALEAAATCLSIRDSVVPPTIHCKERDPDLDLDVCFDRARPMDIPLAMTNSYGLGGTNASLILMR